MTVVVILLVTWAYAGATPDVTVMPTASMHDCEALARQFIVASEAVNASGPPATAEHYSVSCERKNGADVVRG